ncbi:MAG: hypothetical protein Q9188_004595 [Gyalolechia gomerana]
MGCGMSTPAKAKPKRGTAISAPHELILQVPRPQLDYNSRPIRVEDYELDRQTLRAALNTMADYIDSHRQEITVITVGGAVNTMMLRTRDSTHDLDFFGTNLDNAQRVLLDEAARYAERRSATPLGAEWFNNQTMLWIPPDVHRTVTQEAMHQNEVVFYKKGLRVIAAPWNYAFCGKMNRLVRPDQARPYDLPDAVSYLRRYIEQRGGPVPVAAIQDWCRRYQKDTNADVLQRIGSSYRERYGANGIAR